MLTRGRTSSSLGVFALHAPVLALIAPEQLGRNATPEDRRIIELCQTPMSVAELSARLDRAGRRRAGARRRPRRSPGWSTCVRPRTGAEHRDVRLLERLLEGIRAI